MMGMSFKKNNVERMKSIYPNDLSTSLATALYSSRRGGVCIIITISSSAQPNSDISNLDISF